MKRIYFLFSFLIALAASAQSITMGRAPGNFAGSDAIANSYTATSTGNAFVRPTGGKDCLNGASCTIYVSSDGTNLSAVAPGTVNVSALSASTSVQTPAILGPNGTTRIAIPSNGTTTITSTQPTTGSAIGTILDTTQTYATGDTLLAIKNNGSTKFNIDGTGSAVLGGTVLQWSSTGSTGNLRASVNDSGGAKTAIAFQNASTLSNAASNIWCGYSDNGVTSALCLRKDGTLIPSADNVTNLGAASSRFNAVYATSIADSNNLARISGIATNLDLRLRGNVATGSNLTAVKIGNGNLTLNSAGDRITGFYAGEPTSAPERSYVGFDGSYNGLVNATGGWQSVQLSAPTGTTVTPSTTGGTLAAGSYCYRVAALGMGAISSLSTIPAAEVCASTTGSTGSETVSWNAVLGASGYSVYCRTTGAEQLCATITNPTTVSWVDTNAVTPSGTIPATNSTGRGLMNNAILCLDTSACSKAIWAGGSGVTVSQTFISSSATADLGTASFPWRDLYQVGKVKEYNGVTTAGLGVSPTYAYGSQTAITTSGTTVATYTPSAQGFFEIGGSSQITAWTSGTSGGLQVAYTDCTGAAQTLRLNGESGTGPTANVQTLSATGSINFYTQSFCANAATITLQAINPGVATVSYYGFIRQVN